MTVTLNLGGVVFADFEIPESIRTGGDQMTNVHKLPGGQRQIDVMGPDDAPISWSGRFRGSDATERARLLDSMRRQGAQLLLSWGAYRYQVVIKRFEPEYRQSYEIPYTITVEVVQDEIMALVSAATGFLESIAGDMVAALGLGGIITAPVIDTALTGMEGAISNYRAGVPASTNIIAGVSAVGEGSLLNALQSSVGTAQTAISSAFGSSSAAFASSTLPTVGSDAAAMSAALSGQASSMMDMSMLNQLGSYVNRIGKNIANEIAA